MLTKRFAILSSAGALVILLGWLYLGPALFSENSIRASLLKQTPMGSSMVDVRALAEKNHWLTPGAGPGHSIYWISGPSVQGVEGANILCGRLRRDPFPYRTELEAAWLFDSGNRLVAITVIRHE